MAYVSYDPKNPWREGEKIIFATFDEPDADTRELDSTTATVIAVNENDIEVDTIYGRRAHDPWSFVISSQTPR